MTDSSRMRVAAAALAGLLALAGSPAAADGLTAESMWALKRVGTPSISPDGRFAVVPVSTTDVEKNRGDGDLWIVPMQGGEARQLTAGPSSDGDATWSPDGRSIAFVARRDDDESTQIYVIPVDGGEARRITSIPTGVAALKWFPDSSRIAFVSRVVAEHGTDWEKQGAYVKNERERKMTARVWDDPPVTQWDRFVDARVAHIFSVGRDGGAVTAITMASGRPIEFNDPGGSSGLYDISPDGREIAYVSDTDTTGIDANNDIYIVPTDGGQARNLTEGNAATDAEPRYSPDGRFLALTQGTVPRFWSDRRRLVLYDRAARTFRVLTEGWDQTAQGLVWLPDSSGLLGAIDDAGTVRVYRFALDETPPVRLTDGANVDALSISRQGTPVIAAIRQSFGEPPTLVRVEPSGDTVKLSAFNDEALARIRLGRTESVTYKGANGADIQMWVTYPPDFDPSRKYPVFLILHGGPHVGITNAWHWRWNAQIFANWGYVAAWHNFHGSSGFGQAFTDSINPDWATLPYEDTIKAAEWFKAQTWADSGRMIAGGGSYGGYLATLLLGREHPFKALIAHAAVYNLYAQVASDGWAGKARFWEYWEEPEKFQAISPHMAAANFRTPTLVIHGQLDYRVPVGHGFEIFQTLRKKGVPSRFVYYPDENHWILKPQNSIHWYSEVERWVKEYAPPR